MNPVALHSLGTFTGELQASGYGPRPIVRFDRPLPKLINNGWNHWTAPDMRTAAIEGDLPQECNDLRDLDAPWRGWQGWIHARFTNGETPLFITPDSTSWDNALKRFTGNVYKITG